MLSIFEGDDKFSIEDHISVFHFAYGIMDVPTKDVVIHLFIRNLSDVVAEWFHHPPHFSISIWGEMLGSFET